jgi:hypothetical protein
MRLRFGSASATRAGASIGKDKTATRHAIGCTLYARFLD